MRRRVSLIVALMLISLTVVGCGQKEELENPPTLSLEDIINEETLGDEKSEECPEGYVYDYQVSMEPIPKEIADLGGDVCGTIHAYPTRIQIALTKQEIENDVELQKQNEENIEGVKEYLANTYGGEFEIEPAAINTWSYVCTEKATDKRFILYLNPLYSKDDLDVEVVTADTYFYEENASIYRENLSTVMKSTINHNYVYRIFQERVDEYINFKVYIAIFIDTEPILVEEQEMIIDMYEQIFEMRENCSSEDVEMIITYFPISYQDVITTQYNSCFLVDILKINYERADKLIEEGEVYAQFTYDEGINKEDETSLNKIVTEGKDSFDNGIVLPYWR